MAACLAAFPALAASLAALPACFAMFHLAVSALLTRQPSQLCRVCSRLFGDQSQPQRGLPPCTPEGGSLPSAGSKGHRRRSPSGEGLPRRVAAPVASRGQRSKPRPWRPAACRRCSPWAGRRSTSRTSCHQEDQASQQQRRAAAPRACAGRTSGPCRSCTHCSQIQCTWHSWPCHQESQLEQCLSLPLPWLSQRQAQRQNASSAQ